MAKTHTISPEALEVLKRGTFLPFHGGFGFKLPPGRLERKLYSTVNTALEAAGGRWNKGAQQHLFDHDPRAELGVTIATGKAVNRKQTLQLFPTPAKVAERMVDLLDHTSVDRVLEPSAGTGRLLEALLAEGDPRELLAIEKDPELLEGLKQGWQAPNRYFLCLDFLVANGHSIGTFERILMNPPFERGADIKHILWALGLLKPGGRLVAICAAGPKQRDAFQKPLGKPGGHPWLMQWQTLPAKTFAREGTNIETAMLLFVRPE